MPLARLPVVVALGVSVLTSPLVGLAEPGPEGPVDAAASGAAPAAAPARAGSWIQVDPQTGTRMPGRPVNAAIAADPAFSTSHSGLVEEASPRGGMMINLQGRFRSAATATVGADGKPLVDCLMPGKTDRSE